MTIREALALGVCLALVIGACFEGQYAQGLPCTSDADCGPTLSCIEGACGGPGKAGQCGNGLLDLGEVCDDGNVDNGDGCSENCDLCGNGITESGEECDDGNTAAGDSCTPACRFGVCGDGFSAPGEACDDGNEIGTDGCTPACTLPACGDGFVNVEWEICDDGNAVETDACTTECTESPETPTLELNLAQVKQFQLSWEPALGAAYYLLFERADPDEEFVQVGGVIVDTSVSLTVPLHFREHASYELRAYNESPRVASSAVVDVPESLAKAIGYFKASNPDEDDNFGSSVAISDDGQTLAVGAPREASNETGIGGDQTDDSSPNAGAVYVFRQQDGSWEQQAYIKGDTASVAQFGTSVALSADGSTLAVGAPVNDISGAAYVFVRNAESWSQQERFEAAPFFGISVALSNDGHTLAVGENRTNNNTGAAQVFVRQSHSWSHQADITVFNGHAGDQFGLVLSLSSDGNTLAVGAPYEDGGSPGIDGDENDLSISQSGAAYVFARDSQSETWSQQAYVKASNPGVWDVFGASLALSGDGESLIVGATGEDSAATGIGGSQGDDFPPAEPPLQHFGAGAVYVFARDDSGWSQQTYVKASNTMALGNFGWSVALSEDANVMAVTADQASYVFVRGGDSWSEKTQLQTPGVRGYGYHAPFAALTGDASMVVLGDPGECGGIGGIGNTPNDDSLRGAGAAHLY